VVWDVQRGGKTKLTPSTRQLTSIFLRYGRANSRELK
jgi:hypothetical protein